MRTERSRRRVLTVLTFDPWPVRSGITRRLDALVRALDEDADQTVLVLDVGGASHPSPLGGQVVRVARDPSRARSLWEALRSAPRLRPVTASFYVRPELREAVARELARVNPDVVFTHGIGGMELVRGLVDPRRVVLDADTIDPATFRGIARDTGGARKLQWWVDAAVLPLWHRRRLPSLGGVCVVSDRDLVEYPRLAPGARLCLVPNGVDLPSGPSAGSAAGPLLFVGAMHYPPNASAVRWLVQQLLPELPGARLLVVGEGVVPDHPRVRATGYVESLDEVWRGASALVVPLRAGGGTRLKVLEAMAHGVPVLSTALGVEGLGAVPGEHYLEAETVEDFAEAARRLATDVALRARLCAAGRSLAERYEWSRCVAPLLSMVRSL